MPAVTFLVPKLNLRNGSTSVLRNLKTLLRANADRVGADGWSGDEVASFPIDIWAELLAFYNACERWGTVPDSRRRMRQFHIPKPNEANACMMELRTPKACGPSR